MITNKSWAVLALDPRARLKNMGMTPGESSGSVVESAHELHVIAAAAEGAASNAAGTGPPVPALTEALDVARQLKDGAHTVMQHRSSFSPGELQERFSSRLEELTSRFEAHRQAGQYALVQVAAQDVFTYCD